MTIAEFTEAVRAGANAASTSHRWNKRDQVHVCEWVFDDPRYHFALFLPEDTITDADDMYVQATIEEVQGRYQRVRKEQNER